MQSTCVKNGTEDRVSSSRAIKTGGHKAFLNLDKHVYLNHDLI